MTVQHDPLSYFRRMLRARRFDEVLCEHGAFVNDTYHVSIGLETSAAAIAESRRADDVILLNHRNHGQLAACGASAEIMYREIFGREGGSQRGKLGSFHLIDVENGIPYVSAMLAGAIPLAVGMALANSRVGRSAISFAYLGDGAMDEGIVYEGFNIASAWNVPVVVVCDNNGSKSSTFRSKFCDVAHACGLAAFRVDAQKPFEVFTIVNSAAQAARRGEGPQFVEIQSESWPGNTTGNHPRNVTGPFEVGSAFSRIDDWSIIDPLVHLVRALPSRGVTLEAMLQVDLQVTTEINESVAAALGAPIAPPAVIFEHVWGEE
ncbi:thiamine pyrophosphate-dependent enzyme, partial [Ferrimicrobium acidiphilum]|uniref:thiamine pyrophosphate-dependent enzyme n=1 Tax=Ferrimicrobium acidiphilum TaxID=121039 RepID=UPI0023EF69A4